MTMPNIDDLIVTVLADNTHKRILDNIGIRIDMRRVCPERQAILDYINEMPWWAKWMPVMRCREVQRILDVIHHIQHQRVLTAVIDEAKGRDK